MKCPKCGQEIDMSEIMREMGRVGGTKSKRTISLEQQKKMQNGRKKPTNTGGV